MNLQNKKNKQIDDKNYKTMVKRFLFGERKELT